MTVKRRYKLSYSLSSISRNPAVITPDRSKQCQSNRSASSVWQLWDATLRSTSKVVVIPSLFSTAPREKTEEVIAENPGETGSLLYGERVC